MISSIFRSTFHGATLVEELHEKYEEAESLMLDELHHILIMDTGRADIADIIEKMNYQVAVAQKVGGENDHNHQKVLKKLSLNNKDQNSYQGVT
jgi:hypothetical protein